MFKAIKRNVFVRVLYITSGKFKFLKKKKDHTHKVIDVVKSHKLKREPGRGGGFGARGCARLGSQEGAAHLRQ